MNLLNKYKFELLIIFIQLIEPISLIGLILGSIYIFYIIAFKSKFDLVSVFILLIPSIALGYRFENIEYYSNPEISTNWIKLYLPAVKTVYLLGPIAISIPFVAAIAVPFRLILFFRNNCNKILVIIWFLVLIISIIGLVLAIIKNQVSTGGLTVGLRIALSIGAILFPLSVNGSQFERQLMIIIKISVVLFLFGLLNGLWKFVFFAFPTYLVFSNENKGWKILGFISLIIILFFDFTFTLKITALFSFFLLLYYKKEKLRNLFLNFRKLKYLAFLFPILIVIFLVYSNLFIKISDYNLFSDKFVIKLLDDRVPIWTYSLDLVLNSNFFLVPAARDITVYNYTTLGEDSWGHGAHNIYLEMARQLGLFATLLITYIIAYILFKSIYKIKGNLNLSKFLLSLFAVYVVWSLTGNALVYDGTGFLFWLIIGQIYQSGTFYKKQIFQKINRI